MSNPTLDHAAEVIASVRAQSHLAALEPVERSVIDRAMSVAPELDRHVVGAAWMLLANALAELTDGADLSTVQAVNIAQLAGQRLYTGEGLAREVRCPQVYGSGAQCKHVVKGLHDSSIDAQMQGHYATYHPDATWPPEPTPVVSDSAHPGWYSGLEPFSRCACGEPATLAVGYRGERGPVPQCIACATRDPRHYFGHRNIDDLAAPIVYDRPAPDARYFARCSKCTKPVVMNGVTGQNAGHMTIEGILCGACNRDYKRRAAAFLTGTDVEQAAIVIPQHGDEDEPYSEFHASNFPAEDAPAAFVHGVRVPQPASGPATTWCGRTEPGLEVAVSESIPVTCPDCVRTAGRAPGLEPVVRLPHPDANGLLPIAATEVDEILEGAGLKRKHGISNAFGVTTWYGYEATQDGETCVRVDFYAATEAGVAGRLEASVTALEAAGFEANRLAGRSGWYLDVVRRASAAAAAVAAEASAQPPLPHAAYMEQVAQALEARGVKPLAWWAETPDGETLDGVFRFDDKDVNPKEWPDGVVLQWSQDYGWQLCSQGESRNLYDLEAGRYDHPRAVAVEAGSRLRRGMGLPLRDCGERAWDGAAATEAAVRAWEADGRAADQATQQYFGELDYEKYREANPLPGDEDEA